MPLAGWMLWRERQTFSVPLLTSSIYIYSFLRFISKDVIQSVNQPVSLVGQQGQSVSQSISQSVHQSVNHISSQVARLSVV